MAKQGTTQQAGSTVNGDYAAEKARKQAERAAASVKMSEKGITKQPALQVNGNTLRVYPHEYASGKLGFVLADKVTIEGRVFQLSGNLVMIG